jgi:hypothetical protein
MKQHHSSVFEKILITLVWALIALLLAATFWAVTWGAKHSRVDFSWGGPSDGKLTRNYTQMDSPHRL